jgi:glycosyltransferase involved in cell wall biosynthesis
VIPNGVDLEYFRPDLPDAPVDNRHSAASARLECLFVGALDYLPNVDGVSWFAREVWPDVYARFPEARFTLVGRRPVAQIRRLTRQPGVELIGEVADVRPYLRSARLVVVPLRIARGIQNKVLVALASGKPVIASPRALGGLELVPNEHVYQAETPARWIRCISSLLGDGDEFRRIASAGRRFVCQQHGWDSCLLALERLLGIPATHVQHELLSATLAAGDVLRGSLVESGESVGQ